ncbi:geranylgeranyl pyrophosphate synthetase [Cordyceps fumosorosea ARSEF 2679]|uniref:Geranylgeranyl pyrophosphate synthetase n=1 Tax=Cordyceps fumosorosea (strain ARSEF 2679) TaxID=1081104 RepID=A0A167R484_CORFA|nr:geranylgeranyl pyrophosphate synthetase [Cordyceps fumosorosea ARSEF 2679]OAA58257.1 geranylgeranyl pyrophosphate synthetase [Cordyceps fumosorosea ARSEF 2679]
MGPSKAAAVECSNATHSTHTTTTTTTTASLRHRTSSNPLSLPSAIPPRTSSNAGSRASLMNGQQQQQQQQQRKSPPAPTQPPAEIVGFVPVTPAIFSSRAGGGNLPASHHRRPSPLSGSASSPSLKSPAQHSTASTASTTSSPSAIMQHQLSPITPDDPSRYATEDLHFTPQRSWTSDKERIVRGPFDYALSHPGKDIRSQLIAAFDEWLCVPPASLAVITRVVGMLHEASLLVDDVQDSSELRRGFPVAHHIFGVAQTINAANYVYFAALQELLALGNGKALLATFAEELVNLHRGQGMDLFWRDSLTCPSEDDYLEMVGNKTGGLFRLGIKLMQAESPLDPPLNCVPLANLIGLIFQIRDDYINLKSDEYSQHKGMCEDLTEGKFSFPVIHSIRARPDDLQLVNILRQKTADVQVKRYAVAYMEGTGSFEYTKGVLATLIERARKLTMELDAGRGKQGGILAILDKMTLGDSTAKTS